MKFKDEFIMVTHYLLNSNVFVMSSLENRKNVSKILADFYQKVD